MNILIADDDFVSRRLLQTTLVGLGHDVVEVDNGVSAVAALETPGGPCCAILDWMMPDMDGLTVCRTVRQLPGRYLYLILLTSRQSPDDMIEGLDSGADDFLTKPYNIAELRARLRAGERVLALQDDLLRSQEVLKHEATHDRLTGLWNRGRILDELGRELRRTRRESTSLAVVMADVDHFKRINDSHGHAVGDTVLHRVGQRILSTLRASDSIGRFGGEEFLLVLPRADVNGGRDVAERVRASLAAAPVIAPSGEVRITMSLGVACSTTTLGDSAALVEAADRALYEAKANGRNRVELSVTGPRRSVTT
jgi:two-component system, cell cycle response regulator